MDSCRTGFGSYMRSGVFLLSLVSYLTLSAWGAVGGSISGTIKDASGGVIPGAMLTVTNSALGTTFKTTTDARGYYSFPSLPVGRYELTIEAAGFQTQKKTGLAVDSDSALELNATVQVAALNAEVVVSATEAFSEVHVETVATQLGEVVSDRKMTTLSLNGRSYTDLLPIQPGVTPITTMKPNSVIMAGVTGPISPSGELNAGNVSISGQRESANGFMVNGSDVQEHMNGGTGVVPNLDSISEFRVLTNNFDPEYGNYNGGMINVVSKSGSDSFHGNVFHFLRNTSLDARNFFATDRAVFKQNQFGGTIGGPIKKGQVFFFADYQGTRTTEGVDTGLIPVPTNGQRVGNFADAGSLTGAVNGSYWANLLSQKLGYAVSPGERYYTSGCTSPAQCVFPNAVIPSRVWSTPAQRLLQYIPAANSGDGLFSTSAFAHTVRDDKTSGRIDANSRWGFLSGYYFLDDYRHSDPYPGQQGGASIPGFDALTVGRAQLIALTDSKAFGSNMVNEFHFSITRNANDVGRPFGGTGVKVADQGFVTGPGTPGIVVQAPQFDGVENIVFNSFVMGVTITGVEQNNNTYHWSDNLSRVFGAHTMKFGGQFHFDQVNMHPNATFNGTFVFSGTETGSDFADFLLGIPSNYIQSAGGGFYLRNKYAGLYFQDSWKARSNLTVNYGLRWDLVTPWYEKYNQLQTVVQGEKSVVYPGAPDGFVFPGDQGISRGLSPARSHNLAPRLGFAYSPTFSNGFLKTVFGDAGKSSIRSSFGIFYTAFQGLSAGIMYGVPPYGYNYLSPAPPLFDKPFITAADGTDNTQRFPIPPPPLDASPKKPYPNIDWSNFIPINADPYFSSDNRVPYSENYMLSVQRELAKGTLLTISYVGNQSHHLLVMQQANPGNPALCLSVSDPSQVAPGSPTCGPFAENGVFTTKSGRIIDGTRAPLGPDYGTMTAQKTIANSNYNAFETNLRYTAARAEFLLGYTYSKSIDQGSNMGEQINPFDPGRSRTISSWDMKHNFVASYSYSLPFDVYFRPNRLTQGWSISGIARFSSGLPVTLYNNTDTSLLGTFGNGVNNDLLDTPDVAPGPLNIHTNPRDGKPAFNSSLFSMPALGALGTAARRSFYGPGIQNFDMTLSKALRLTESKSMQFRLEAFNVLNHAQFYGPASVDGNITSSTFGQVVSAASPRLVQLAAKFMF